MKKKFRHLQLGVLSLVAVVALSCKHEKIADVVKDQTFSPVDISLASRTDIAAGSTYTLTGANMTVPVTLNFSAATSRAFTVDLVSDVDTIAQLITAGTLPAGTTAFSVGAAAVTPQLTIPSGVTSVSFDIVVSRSVIETNYGKTLAAVIKATTPTKGNKIPSGKGTMIFTVKTGDILDASSIHEISFGASNKLTISAGSSYYTLGSESITFNIPISLQGTTGTAFTVDVASVPDTVTKYINDGTLTNNVLYTDDKISIGTPKVSFTADASVAYLTFTTRKTSLLSQQPAPSVPTGKLPTLAFTLKNPSEFQIGKKTPTMLVSLDVNSFRPYYGKPFLVKGTIGVASDWIYAAYYDFGGEGIAYHDDNNKDGDGSWRAPDYVDVSGDYSPRSVVGWTSGGEWLTYSLNVEATGTYQMDTWLGVPDDGGRTYSVYIDGVLINKNLPAARTGDYNNQRSNLSTINLTAGFHILKMYWENAAYDFRGVIFTRKS